MKNTKWIMVIVLAILLAGCASKSTTEKVSDNDIEKFIRDTEKLIPVFEDVYNTSREYTAEEESAVKEYKENYDIGSDFDRNSDTNINQISNGTLLIYLEAKRPSGVEDTFAKDLSDVKRYIEEVKAKK